MDISLLECIKQLETEIAEKENQIQLLKNLNLNDLIDENKWHELCLTPFRNSNELSKLVLKIFQNAEDVKVSCNYVYFTLYGYKIQIPTSLCRGINVDTGWFHKCTKPNNVLSKDETRMKRYFECIDTQAGWYDCARCRLGTHWRKWYLFIIWWVKYKWKDVHREEWENKFRIAESSYQDRLVLFYDKKREMENKIIIFVEKVLPEINKFSTEHYSFNGNYSVEIENILNEYNAIDEECFYERNGGDRNERIKTMPILWW